MEEKKEENLLQIDILGIVQSFLKYLRKKWLQLLLCGIFGAALGVGYYFIQKPRYEAVTTFILEEKSAGSGGLAGLASQFGFNIGSMTSGGSIFAGDNILDILLSKQILYKALLSRPDTVQGAKSQTLADIFLSYKGWKKKWSSKPYLKDISYQGIVDIQMLTPRQDSVLTLIYESLLKNSLIVDRLNKKGSIIKVRVTAPDRLFARSLTEKLVDEAAKLYLDIKTGTAQANIDNMQRRADSLLYLLNRKSYNVAAIQPLDMNPGVKSAVVPTEIAIRDKSVLGTLYAEVTKNLEASKLLLSQQTPVIQILDRPGLLLEDKKSKIIYLIVVGGLLAGFAYVMLAFVHFLLYGDSGISFLKMK